MNKNPRITSPPNTLLTANEVAHMLNISRAYAYKLIDIGELISVKIGNAVRVRPEDLQEYVSLNSSASIKE